MVILLRRYSLLLGWLLVGLGLLLLSPEFSSGRRLLAQSQDLTGKFYVEVRPSSGTLEDTFLFSVVLEGIKDPPYPLIVGGDDFKLALLGPEISLSDINGQISSLIKYNYRLIPTRIGELESPGAEIKLGADTYQAKPIKIKIASGSTPPSLQGGLEDIFIRQSTDKQSVFLGEQLLHVLEFYRSQNELIEPTFDDQSYDGFRSESFGENQEFHRTIAGRHFAVIAIRTALFPLSTGTLNIPSRELRAKIPERTRQRSPFPDIDPFNPDLFDRLFGAPLSYKDASFRSNALDITVKELPTPPPNFPGWDPRTPLVGHTGITLSLDKSTIKVGDSKTIEATLTSFGNINPIKTIPIKDNPLVKIYQEIPQTILSENSGKLLFKRTVKISIVPTSAGEVYIPPIEIGYFDADTQTYKVARSSAIAFSVTGPKVAPVAPILPAEENTDTKDERLSPSTTATPLKYTEESFFENLSTHVSLSLSLLILSSLLVVLFGFLLVTKGFAFKREKTRIYRKVGGARSVSELSEVFRKLLATKLQLTESSYGSEQLKALVRKNIVDDDIQFTIQEILDEVDLRLYSEGNSPQAALAPLKEKIKQLVQAWAI